MSDDKPKNLVQATSHTKEFRKVFDAYLDFRHEYGERVRRWIESTENTKPEQEK